jgi:hypothetical protein
VDLNLPFPPTPENAARFAALAADAALNVGGVALDYSPATLELLERFLAVHGDERREAAVLTFGCYLGEVFVRAGLGCWRATDDTPMKGMADVPLLVELNGGDYCNPIGRVRRFLDEGASKGLAPFWEAFGAGTRPARRPWWRRLFGG